MDEIFMKLDTIKTDILVTLGAGNIDTLVPLIRKRYEIC